MKKAEPDFSDGQNKENGERNYGENPTGDEIFENHLHSRSGYSYLFAQRLEGDQRRFYSRLV